MILRSTTWVRQHWLFCAIIILVALKHSILAEQPFVARSTNPHDDTLFLSQAFHILAGEWLGPYNQFPLLRGPFYPIWIRFVYVLGVPLIHANDFLYLGACLLTMRALLPLESGHPILFFIFVLLYFAPHTYDYATVSHAFRMQINSSLVLLVCASSLGLGIRMIYRSGPILPWSLLLGLSFSFFWYTREEGIWILPALLLLVICVGGLMIHRDGWSTLGATILHCFVVPGVVLAICTSALLLMNNHFYGAPVVRDIKAKQFKHAYNGLLRIKSEELLEDVHVTRKTLRKLYELSPKMKELKPHLEYTAENVPFFGGQLRAAIFIFAVRDATAAAGYYDQDAAETLEFYKELGDELEALCDIDQVECGNLLLSMVPLWRYEYTLKLPEAFFKQLYLMIRFPEFNVMPDGTHSYANRRFLYNSGRLSHSMPRVTEQYQWDQRFPAEVKEFKFEIARVIGDGHQIIRPVLFVVALVGWLYFVISDLRNQKLSFLNCYTATLLVGLSTLAAALAIIEATSFHMLFRPRHGGYPLVSLVIVCAGVEWRRRTRIYVWSEYS